jgi:hypothetical protein
MKTKNDYLWDAAQRGSTCTTFAGAKKWMLKHPVTVVPLLGLTQRLPIRADKRMRGLPTEPRTNNLLFQFSLSAYLASEKKRKSNPEAKRARDDSRFRRNWLSRINREIDSLANPPAGTLDQITDAANSRSDRATRIERLTAQKTIALDRKFLVREIPANSDLPGGLIGGFDADFARKHGVGGINMSGEDATIEPTRRSSHGHHNSGETTWKNGEPVSYTRAQHDNFVRSFALIRPADPRTVDYVFHLTEVSLTLPDGYVWGNDINGLRAVHGADDFHVSAPDLLAKNAVEKIVEFISKNAETRRRRAAELLAEKAEIEGIFCCVADSLRAGNCLAGTRGFAERHQLDIHRHYHAPELLQIANGDTSRVRIVIQAARNQARIDAERGFSVLAEHALPVS